MSSQQRREDEEPLHAREKLGKKKVPVRIVFCPKCMIYGAKLDYRNTDMQVVTSNIIIDKDGNKTKIIKTLVHTIHCRECGEITRRVR